MNIYINLKTTELNIGLLVYQISVNMKFCDHGPVNAEDSSDCPLSGNGYIKRFQPQDFQVLVVNVNEECFKMGYE